MCDWSDPGDNWVSSQSTCVAARGMCSAPRLQPRASGGPIDGAAPRKRTQGGPEQAAVGIAVRPLRRTDGPLLTRFLREVAAAGVTSEFHPHPFDAATAERLCAYRGKDWYSVGTVGARRQWLMAGYVMLRGWDEGFLIPSFGICVHPDWQGFGLGRLLTQAAIAVARLRRSPAIRLKVYPANTRALGLYRSLGFLFSGESERGQLVGLLSLDPVAR